MEATNILKHEHRVIERGLTVLESMAERIKRGEPVPPGKVEVLLDFFCNFADRCHHAKEERTLFPGLEGRGISHVRGCVGVTLFEHATGRTFLRLMAGALPGLSENASEQRRFANAACGYTSLLRRHIAKEDNMLFEMVESGSPNKMITGWWMNSVGTNVRLSARANTSACTSSFSLKRWSKSSLLQACQPAHNQASEEI